MPVKKESEFKRKKEHVDILGQKNHVLVRPKAAPSNLPPLAGSDRKRYDNEKSPYKANHNPPMARNY